MQKCTRAFLQRKVQVRQHDVVAVAPNAAYGRAASEGDLRHRVAPVTLVSRQVRNITIDLNHKMC